MRICFVDSGRNRSVVMCLSRPYYVLCGLFVYYPQTIYKHVLETRRGRLFDIVLNSLYCMMYVPEDQKHSHIAIMIVVVYTFETQEQK
jgi:hypothetical protein